MNYLVGRCWIADLRHKGMEIYIDFVVMPMGICDIRLHKTHVHIYHTKITISSYTFTANAFTAPSIHSDE